MSMRSPLGRVRGLGSAREGVGHWWAQRMTALALVPLALWFVAALITLTGADHAAAREWIAAPVPASLLVLWIVAPFYPGPPGLRVGLGAYGRGGGGLGARVVIEAVGRLIPGVVGSMESVQDDSFTTGLLQHPQYTRPDDFRGWSVPGVLTSGNHAEVDRWRRGESLRRTYQRRPERLESANLSDEARRFIAGLRQDG